MIKVNIEKEIQTLSRPDESLLRSAQQLLITLGEKDLEILRAAGLDHHIRQAAKDHAKLLVHAEISKEYGVEIVTGEDIKKLCVKYRLKFLPSKCYNGAIPPELGSIISRFVDKLHVPNKEYAISKNLYIMAPKEAFNIVSYEIPSPKDPVLFYKFSTTEGEYYAVLRKWGNDFTIFRRIQGMIFKNQISYMRWFFMTKFILGLSVLFLCTSSLNWFVGLSALYTLVITVMRIALHDDALDPYFSEEGYNQETEPKIYHFIKP